MEMERINDDLIKVLINAEDLEKRGIDFLDLIGDQPGIERFFYSILEEVDIDKHFQESEAVTFQVMPNADGLELYISRGSYAEMDEFWADEFSRRVKDHRTKKTEKKSGNSKNVTKNTSFNHPINREFQKEVNTYSEIQPKIVMFKNLDSFLAVANEINPIFNNKSSLYYMNNQYYLYIDKCPTFFGNTEYEQFMYILEYAEPTTTTKDILEEYGELIREDDALDFFAKNF